MTSNGALISDRTTSNSASYVLYGYCHPVPRAAVFSDTARSIEMLDSDSPTDSEITGLSFHGAPPTFKQKGLIKPLWSSQGASASHGFHSHPPPVIGFIYARQPESSFQHPFLPTDEHIYQMQIELPLSPKYYSPQNGCGITKSILLRSYIYGTAIRLYYRVSPLQTSLAWVGWLFSGFGGWWSEKAFLFIMLQVL